MSKPRRLSSTIGVSVYLVVMAGVPLLTLAGLGLVRAYEHNDLVALLLGWLLVSLIGYGGLWWYGKRRERSPDEPATEDALLPSQLTPHDDWSQTDLAVWATCREDIESRLSDPLPWRRLQPAALDLIAIVASHYHGTTANPNWRFTLPEGLLIVEETARRYRRLVGDHLPYADRLTVASLLSVYQHHEEIETGTTALRWVRRAFRLTNPAAAVVGELRDQVTQRVFDEVKATAQIGLKRLLLQEVSQVAIDLYSGRLRVSDEHLAEYESTAARADRQAKAPAPEPLRVLLLGQISAGKSSLINALRETFAAETDPLPATNQVTVYPLPAPEGYVLHLLDTPGIDTEGAQGEILTTLALDADLLIWVVKANQPGRAGIGQLITRITAAFAADPARRPPPELFVLTHVDQLPPMGEWSPPYNLDSAVPKALTMHHALEGIASELGLEDRAAAVPVCLDATVGRYNVDTVAAALFARAEAAQQAQLNRRRVELARAGTSWSERWTQFTGLGRAVGAAFRRPD